MSSARSVQYSLEQFSVPRPRSRAWCGFATFSFSSGRRIPVSCTVCSHCRRVFHFARVPHARSFSHVQMRLILTSPASVGLSRSRNLRRRWLGSGNLIGQRNHDRDHVEDLRSAQQRSSPRKRRLREEGSSGFAGVIMSIVEGGGRSLHLGGFLLLTEANLSLEYE